MRRQSGLLGCSGLPVAGTSAPTGAPVHRRHCIAVAADATAATTAPGQSETVAQTEPRLVEATTGTDNAPLIAATAVAAIVTTVVGRNV